MCRWFAYISPTEPCLLSDVLITPANSISKQCSEHYLPKLLPHGDEKELDHTSDELLRMRNALLNMDGLGVACTCTYLGCQASGFSPRMPKFFTYIEILTIQLTA